MSSYRRVVHPTDFSDASAEALPYAMELAKRHDAELVLLHVFVPPDIVGAPNIDEIIRQERADRQNRLNELVEIARRDRPGTQAEVVVARSGSQGILDFASHEATTLIVMGTLGWGRARLRNGGMSDTIGSTAEKVVRLAPCSVLTVRPGVRRHPSAMSRILVPVDFSPHSRLALSVAGELARASGAIVTVLHVIEPIVHPVFYGRGGVGLELDGGRLETRAHQEIERLIKKTGRSMARARIRVRRGRPDSEIVNLAREEDSQMIMQGSRGLSGLNYMLLGSVAERVVRSSHCPVLTIKGRRELQHGGGEGHSRSRGNAS